MCVCATEGCAARRDYRTGHTEPHGVVHRHLREKQRLAAAVCVVVVVGRAARRARLREVMVPGQPTAERVNRARHADTAPATDANS